MFDPAALGTLRIGLDAISAQQGHHQIGRPSSRRITPPRRSQIRPAIANSLRWVARMLDRPAVGEAAS
jgi:hypothetical protein